MGLISMLKLLSRLLDGFSVDGVVLPVRADELDVDPLHFVGHANDQPVVVALDVEHHAVVRNDARVAVLGLDIRRLRAAAARLKTLCISATRQPIANRKRLRGLPAYAAPELLMTGIFA
jgi:hypothetical protein